MSLLQIENSLSKELPIAYKEFLSSFEDFVYILHNENPNEFPDAEGTPWFFWGESRLFEKVIIDGAKTRNAWEQLASYAEIDEEFRKRKSIPSNRGLRSFDHLKKSVAIAEDNGDILYIDTMENNSIWIYLHASGEVKFLAESFDEWLKKSKLD